MMVVCEQWVANDFLIRHGFPPGPACDCPDCPPVQAAGREARDAQR